MGFEALLRGKKVRCFGMPFYGGRGLTTDDLAAPEWRKNISLEQLIHATLVAYPRYYDYENQTRTTPEEAIKHVGFQRQQRNRWPRKIYAFKFSRWKYPLLKQFMAGSHIRFVTSLDHSLNNGDASDRCAVAVWGHPKIFPATASTPIIHVEDAFIRSVGLGAELRRPLSWAIDNRGIYYDAQTPSSLEVLLQTYAFTEDLLQRAKSLREKICANNISKYNLRAREWLRPVDARHVILVPGQVESDSSIRYGCKSIKDNLSLLESVRARNPDSYILYKPHPDVIAGLRNKGQADTNPDRLCNEVVSDYAITTLIDAVDEVHTMTSLTGFESLIRHKKTVCYGQPFYAGWGLTDDIEPIARRWRRLGIDELVAAVLILYPTYIHPRTHAFIEAEQALDWLIATRENQQAQDKKALSKLRRHILQVNNLLKVFLKYTKLLHSRAYPFYIDSPDML